jgi:CsoR family transcriptional regulator, copper-sensing transcriptional repressor
MLDSQIRRDGIGELPSAVSPQPPLGERMTPLPTKPDTTATSTTHGYITSKDRYLDRLRRIEGQVRGVQRMVEDEQYCIDILTQVSAINRALQAVALGLLDDHLKHCVNDAAHAGGDDADVKLKEASAAIGRLVRS